MRARYRGPNVTDHADCEVLLVGISGVGAVQAKFRRRCPVARGPLDHCILEFLVVALCSPIISKWSVGAPIRCGAPVALTAHTGQSEPIHSPAALNVFSISSSVFGSPA